MPGSPVIDLALGLAFVFGVTAALSSAVTELIARFLGLRGAYLLSGLRELLDSGTATTDLQNAGADYRAMKNMASGTTRDQPSSVTGALLGGPILSSQGMAGQISDRGLMLKPAKRPDRPAKLTAAPAADSRPRRTGLFSQRRSLPSYISATSFAEAVIDMLVPTGTGQETMMAAVAASAGRLPGDMPFKTSLEALINNADGDVSRFRASVERWYDDHMARVSGWYKRRVAKITLAVGAILVLLLNINTLTIGRTLYGDSTVNAAVSSVAAKVTNCKNQSDPSCLAGLQAELSAATTAGLPVGWGTVRDCTAPHARCDWLDQRGIFSRHGGSGWQLLLAIAGFLVTIIALVPGARFWFDLLSKLGSLRASGPKPATSTS